MSAEGPESVPTSADPRSRRPTKKRALTPLSAQAASVGALFAKPDQAIRLPPSSSSSALSSRRPPPPEIVTNVQGSSAGAGSGEFHVYKAARRREYERLKEMDQQVRRGHQQTEFKKVKAEKERRDEEKTRKNRERREKQKSRKAKMAKGDGGGKGGGGKGDDGGNVGTEGDDASARGPAASSQEPNGQQTRDERPLAASAEPAAIGLVIHDDD